MSAPDVSTRNDARGITRVKKQQGRFRGWLGSGAMGDDEDPVPGVPAIVIAIGIMVAIFGVVIAVLTR